HHRAEIAEGCPVELWGAVSQLGQLGLDLLQLGGECASLAREPVPSGRHCGELAVDLREVLVNLPLLVAAQRDLEALPGGPVLPDAQRLLAVEHAPSSNVIGYAGRSMPTPAEPGPAITRRALRHATAS